MNKIILTFDWEYWHESLSLQKYISETNQAKLYEFTKKILNLLEKNKATATFFVSGKIIQQESALIKNIHQQGHEVAVHCLNHRPLWQKNALSFNEEMAFMCDQIEKITGQKPLGHRAVNFSLNEKTSWALNILSQNNFKYDSSIFPLKLPKFKKLSSYGIKTQFFQPYRIDLDNPRSQNTDSPLIEFPLAIFHTKLIKIPLAGGIYIRLLPWWLFKKLLKLKLKNEPACLYFHPFDFTGKPKDLKIPLWLSLIKFYNTRNTWQKLDNLTKNYKCLSVIKYYEDFIN